MIGKVSNIAVSGMQAATRRLENSSQNIANISTTGAKPGEAFRPQRVAQVAAEGGGVATNLRAIDPASFKAYDPTAPAAAEDGTVEYPNVNLEEEVVNLHMATYDFKANLKSLKAEDEMTKELLDIIA